MIKNLKLKTKNLTLIVVLVSVFILRYHQTLPLYHNGDAVRITTTVLSDPIQYDRSQYIKIQNLKVYLPTYPEVNYGDRVVIEGVVDNGKLKNAKIQKIEVAKNVLFRFRQKIISFYQASLPDPYSGLLAGITLGSKGTLTSDFWEKVKNAGVAHVVVASGTNVTFVISFLIIFLSNFLSRRKMMLFVVLGIILYLFVSGFQAPLIRASIMGAIVFFAQSNGRIVNSLRILIFTSLLMLVFNPVWISDIGFILSVVATGSLILFEPAIRNKLSFLPKILKEGLSTSLSAQIGVTPILFVTFGQFNILSPIVNALVIWTIPYIMVLGVVGGVIGILMPILGNVILYLSYPLLWWFVTITTLFNF